MTMAVEVQRLVVHLVEDDGTIVYYGAFGAYNGVELKPLLELLCG